MADLLVGAAVGAVFGELLKAVVDMKSRATMFKQTLGYLQTTLIAIGPVIKEIEQHNNDLGRPKEELESLIREMEQGTELVCKCSKISKLNFPARIRYQRQLEELVESLVRFFIINMQAQISRDQKETLIRVRSIHSAIIKRYMSQTEIHDSTVMLLDVLLDADESNVVEITNSPEEAFVHTERLLLPSSSHAVLGHVMMSTTKAEASESKSTRPCTTEEAGTTFVEQRMKDITSLAQNVSQIEANTENSESIDRSLSEKFYDHHQLNGNERRSNQQHLPCKIDEPVLQQHKIGGFKGRVIRKDPFKPRKVIAFEGCPSNFDLEDLLSASVEVLVETVYGTSYKAMLKDGTTLVMKRLKLDVVLGKTEFERHMKIVQRLSQHPNVVPLLACYYSNHEKLLIYNYIAGHSFSSLLHGTMETGQSQLCWESRMKISLGVAKGVAHIHFANEEEEFVHGNISSSNVLVKDDHQGCISYFGLNSLINENSIIINQFGNEIIKGYQAPEAFQSKELLTQKSDVYSFGVLLFEMLTTESPLQYTDNKFLSWVFVHGKKRFHLLASHDHHHADMYGMCRRVMELAIACVARKPKWRPTMNEVVNEMEEIIIASK